MKSDCSVYVLYFFNVSLNSIWNLLLKMIHNCIVIFVGFFFWMPPFKPHKQMFFLWCSSKMNLPCVSEDIWYLSNLYYTNLLNRLKHFFLHDKIWYSVSPAGNRGDITNTQSRKLYQHVVFISPVHTTSTSFAKCHDFIMNHILFFTWSTHSWIV